MSIKLESEPCRYLKTSRAVPLVAHYISNPAIARGTPFITAQDFLQHTPFPIDAVSNPGNTIYIQAPNSTPQLLTFDSFRQRGGDCRPGSETGQPVMTVPAIPLIDLDTLFTPSLSVR